MSQKSQDRKKVLISLMVLIFLGVLLWASYEAYVYYHLPLPTVELKHYLYTTIITDKNLTTDEVLKDGGLSLKRGIIMPEGGIYFYTLSPGLNFTRQTVVTNIFDYPVELETIYVGNITQFLEINMPQKIMAPNTNQTIDLTLRIPNEVLAGKYSGNLTIKIIPKKA